MTSSFQNNQALIPDANSDSSVTNIHHPQKVTSPCRTVLGFMLILRRNPSWQGHCGTDERGSVKAL